MKWNLTENNKENWILGKKNSNMRLHVWIRCVDVWMWIEIWLKRRRKTEFGTNQQHPSCVSVNLCERSQSGSFLKWISAVWNPSWLLESTCEHSSCRKFTSHQTWTNPLSRLISLSRRIEGASRRRWQPASCGDACCHCVLCCRWWKWLLPHGS